MYGNNREEEIKGLDYSSKDAQILMKEYTILLDKVCKDYENIITQLEESHRKEVDELKRLCDLYEGGVNKTLLNTLSITFYKGYIKLKKDIKVIIKNFLSIAFKVIKKIVVILGVKDKLKNTIFFKLLKEKGIIDKLRVR